MKAPDEIHLRLSIDREYLAYMAYRETLKHVVELAKERPFEHSEEAEIAEAVLEAFEPTP